MKFMIFIFQNFFLDMVEVGLETEDSVRQTIPSCSVSSNLDSTVSIKHSELSFMLQAGEDGDTNFGFKYHA